MTEWTNVHVCKTCARKGYEGSNPSPCTIKNMANVVYSNAHSQPAIKKVFIDEDVITTPEGQSALAHAILSISAVMAHGEELAALARDNLPLWEKNKRKIENIG